jgi:hypothetical protein
MDEPVLQVRGGAAGSVDVIALVGTLLALLDAVLVLGGPEEATELGQDPSVPPLLGVGWHRREDQGE